MPDLKQLVNTRIVLRTAARFLTCALRQTVTQHAPTCSTMRARKAFTFRLYLGYAVHTGVLVANYNGHEGIPMLVERPRARRHVFSAHLEMLDVESESKIITRTRDLTMFGFRAEIKNCSWPVGTRVRVKITHKASNFTAGARIVWVRKNTDLGVAFTDVTPRDQLILEKWIADLRGSEVLAHSDSV
jgi:hypothetical protein